MFCIEMGFLIGRHFNILVDGGGLDKDNDRWTTRTDFDF